MEDHDKHFVGNVAQKALIEKDGKILVCRGVGDAVWEFPGGRLHAGEAPVDGIVREIKEELGVDISNVRPFVVMPSYHYKSKQHQVFITYTCTYDGSPLTVDSTELEEYKWLTREELKDLPMFEDGGTKGTIDALVGKME